MSKRIHQRGEPPGVRLAVIVHAHKHHTPRGVQDAVTVVADAAARGDVEPAHAAFVGALGDDSLVCSVFDGSDTRFIAIHPATGQPTPVGTLRGQMIVYHAASPGWVSGWADAMPIALRLSTRQAFRAADPQDHITQVTAADHVAGTVSFDGTRSRVRLYAID